MDYFKEIEQEARKILLNTRKSHDWEHTLRVYNLCLKIASVEKADLDVLKLSAILHDVGREEEDKVKGAVCHAKLGAEIAFEILKKYNVDQLMINKVCHCIETHRFKGNKKPESVEAKILFDADKLDAIGAVGLARAFVYSGEIGAKVHNISSKIDETLPYTEEDTAYREYYFKLRKIKDTLFTSTGKLMAEERHKFMVEFFERLNKEVEGEI
jgi:uncharacterized protein